MNKFRTRGARALLLMLAAALLLACAGCGKKPTKPDEYGLAAEKSKLDGTDIGNGLQLVSAGRYAGLFVEDVRILHVAAAGVGRILHPREKHRQQRRAVCAHHAHAR